MEQNLLKSAELKTTKKRQLLLYILKKDNHPMTAEALFAKANEILPINLATVYRTLNTLTEKNILTKSIHHDGKAYFTINNAPHQHHLICTACKKSVSIDTCPLSEMEDTLQKDTGFKITQHSLQFYGICPDCDQQKKT